MKKKPGQIIILSLVFLTFITVVSTALLSRAAGYLRFGANNLRGNQARNLAEAGINYALWQLNKTPGTCGLAEGCGVEKTLGTIGSFIVTVEEKSPPNPQLKTVISTGYVPDATNPRSKRIIKTDVEVDTETYSFHYATQIGTGGIDMGNGAKITGNVWSNKTGASITGAGSAAIIGDAYAAGTIGDPPCTLPNCHKFENQSEIPPLPNFDYNYWEDKADDGGETTCPCTITNIQDIGPKKYIGDLTISSNAIVTMKGAIWVTGNLIVTGGNTKLDLDESFGTNGTVVVLDGVAGGGSGGGTVTVDSNATIDTTSQGGYILIATSSAKNLSEDPAVNISSGGATGIFYALNGMARMTSGNTDVKSIISNGLSMANNTTMAYDTGLASAVFSTGPGGSWQTRKGTYRSD